MPATNAISLRFERRGRSLYAFLSRGLCNFLELEAEDGLAFNEYPTAFRVEPHAASKHRLRAIGTAFYVCLGRQAPEILERFDGLSSLYRLDRENGWIWVKKYDLDHPDLLNLPDSARF